MAGEKVTVTLQDGAKHTVQIGNPDRIRFDLTRAKHGWPTFSEAVFLATTFMAWNAMRRAGLYSDTFEQFSETDAIEVEPVDSEGDEVVEAHPPVRPSDTP